MKTRIPIFSTAALSSGRRITRKPVVILGICMVLTAAVMTGCSFKEIPVPLETGKEAQALSNADSEAPNPPEEPVSQDMEDVETSDAVPSGVHFSDWTPDNAGVQFLLDAGIVTGYPDGTFVPQGTLTRAELCTVLTHMLDTDGVSNQMSSRFSDTADHWASGAIAYLESLGVFAGYPDDSFLPDKAVSVGEVVTVLMRLCGYDDELVSNCTGFPHEPYMREDGAWPYNYIYFANTHFGIWQALDTYGSEDLPTMPCTRKEFLNLIAQCLLDHPIPSHDSKTARQLLGWEYPEPEESDFVVEDGVLMAYTGPDYGNLVIPDDLGITVIGSSFLDQSDQRIYSAVIPEGVVAIGDHAFYLQTALNSVVLPSTLTEIQAAAFQGCVQLSYVTFPDQEIEIIPSAFANSIWEHREEAKTMGLGYKPPEYE